MVRAEARAVAERAREHAEEAQRLRREAEAAMTSARAEREQLMLQLASKTGEVTEAKEAKGKVEAEMRLVLKAMDAQKAAATRNMAQLSKIYDDWTSVL